ncbi:MAG: hypothetical protein ACI8V2_004488 [Candidatus Latescibacterota bacterium]|jgi:hypothetical protein
MQMNPFEIKWETDRDGHLVSGERAELFVELLETTVLAGAIENALDGVTMQMCARSAGREYRLDIASIGEPPTGVKIVVR